MTATHPIDEVLPAPKLAALGLQHVPVMYAGAVAVPLILGRALELPRPARRPPPQTTAPKREAGAAAAKA